MIASPIVDALEVVDKRMTDVIALAKTCNIPVVFALSRRRLAKCIGRPKTKVSIVGLLSYENLQGKHTEMLALAKQLREQWLADRAKRVVSAPVSSSSVADAPQTSVDVPRDSAAPPVAGGAGAPMVDTGAP